MAFQAQSPVTFFPKTTWSGLSPPSPILLVSACGPSEGYSYCDETPWPKQLGEESVYFSFYFQVSTFSHLCNKILDKCSLRKEDLICGSQFKGTVHHGGEVTVARARGSWSHRLHSQKAGAGWAGWSRALHSGTPASGMMLPTSSVCLTTSTNSI